jgi:hypothetical protein
MNYALTFLAGFVIGIAFVTGWFYLSISRLD